jgi:hypothetical protein
MAQSRIDGNLIVNGSFNCTGTMQIPSGTVNDDDVAADADISAVKLRHQHQPATGQANGADVVSRTETVWVAQAAGTIEEVLVRPETAPTGGDKQYTVDVKKAADGSTSFTTVLSSVITVNSSSANGTKQDGVLSVVSYNAGDALQVVVTASGSTGSQGQGLTVALKLREAA